MAVKLTIEDLRADVELKKRAVIYARYSSDRQKEASIEQQTRDCMEYINRMGYELIKIYSDSAKSASKNIEKRSDFLKLIEDSANGEFDVVVSYALDRISREEHGGFYEYEKVLNENGVRIEYATQVFNEEYGGGISKAVHVEMASEYVKQLRKNVIRGMRDNAMNGLYNGGRYLPVGIIVTDGDKKDKKFAPDENMREFIRKAFEMYVDGSTTREVCDYLNEHGVRTNVGNNLTTDSVNRMMANPIYKGTKITTFDNKIENKIYTAENACDAIVSDELWEMAQVEREKRLHTGASERTRGVYELRGKLFCGLCGEKMLADSGKSHTGETHRYYACKNRKAKRASDKTRCKKINVPKEAIESAVMDIVSDFVWNDELIQAYISAAEEADEKATVNPRIAELEKLIRSHKERKCRADNAYMDTGDTDWLQLSKEEKKVIQDYESELRNLNSLTKHSRTAQDFIDEITQLSEIWIMNQKTSEGRADIIHDFVERIDIFDPEPDDPDKFRIKVIIRTNTDADSFSEVEAEVNITVREQLDNDHQEIGHHFCGARFCFYKSEKT